jgi:PKHD-type hydroxylase
MQTSPYWKWDGDLPEAVLALLDADLAKAIADNPAQGTVGTAGNLEVHLERRDVCISFAPVSYWFTGVLAHYASLANSVAQWRRTVTGTEQLQFTKYTEGQHYDWHSDIAPGDVSPVRRKLSVVCLLSDPSEFEGGSLEIEGVEIEGGLKRGSVIVFPSEYRHRVTPVTKGIRRTLVLWLSGPYNP